jgi:hypothetical protein
MTAMKLLPALTALFALTTAPALAEPFVLLIHEAPEQLALRTDPGPDGAAYWAAYADFGREAAAAGIMKGGAAMIPAPVAVAGSMDAAGPLTLGGYFLIDVADAAAAQGWAEKLPAARTGAVEVRAVVPAPGM